MLMTRCLFGRFSSFGVEQCFGNYQHLGLVAPGFFLKSLGDKLFPRRADKFGELQDEKRQSHGLPVTIVAVPSQEVSHWLARQ